MAISSQWKGDLPQGSPSSSITRFIKGGRVTRFYALWLRHRGYCWSIWVGCPKDKIVRLYQLFHNRQESTEFEDGWLAPIIPLCTSATRRKSGHIGSRR
jgi:hypothetical protein